MHCGDQKEKRPATKRLEATSSQLDMGDWGENVGRTNLLASEKVLQGVREVEPGISFRLSLPLDYPGGTALNQRRHPVLPEKWIA